MTEPLTDGLFANATVNAVPEPAVTILEFVPWIDTVVPVTEPVEPLIVTIPCVTPEPVIVTVDPVADVVIPEAPTIVNALEDAVALPDEELMTFAAVVVRDNVVPEPEVAHGPDPLIVMVVPVTDPVLPSIVVIAEPPEAG